MVGTLLGLIVLSLAIWLFLLLFWGQFWRVDQQLETNKDVVYKPSTKQSLPTVCVVVPARNEVESSQLLYFVIASSPRVSW
jgi:hypothetical protein